jgi:hypothetical protein
MYVDVTPVFENTTMQASYNSSNVLIGYRVSPCEGYVLHSSSFDDPVIDEETGLETGEVILGYIDSFVGLTRNYNFETNPLNIYAVLKTEVPADRIFGVDNDHEVM